MICGSIGNFTFSSTPLLTIAIDVDAAGAGVNNVDWRDLDDSPEPNNYTSAW